MEIINKMCGIIKRNEQILIINSDSSTEYRLFQFPKIEIKANETDKSFFFNKMKEKYGVKGQTKDEIICTITHSYKDFDLILHLIQIDLCESDIEIEDLDAKWLSINQIWKLPLANPDVTVAQIILEQD
jgi:adenine-specific DNA glycosylase